MGGHYPSLAYQPTMAAAPDLDSVVRFEGEATLLEMVTALSGRRVVARDPGRGLAARTEIVRQPAAPSDA